MCNLYSQTKDRMTVMMRFKLQENRTAWFEPKSAIFPGNQAPIIRVADDGERMLEEAFWGFVRQPKGKAPGRVGEREERYHIGQQVLDILIQGTALPCSLQQLLRTTWIETRVVVVARSQRRR
jgi:putative SOS response-associated peptidase YedK